MITLFRVEVVAPYKGLIMPSGATVFIYPNPSDVKWKLHKKSLQGLLNYARKESYPVIMEMGLNYCYDTRNVDKIVKCRKWNAAELNKIDSWEFLTNILFVVENFK